MKKKNVWYYLTAFIYLSFLILWLVMFIGCNVSDNPISAGNNTERIADSILWQYNNFEINTVDTGFVSIGHAITYCNEIGFPVRIEFDAQTNITNGLVSLYISASRRYTNFWSYYRDNNINNHYSLIIPPYKIPGTYNINFVLNIVYNYNGSYIKMTNIIIYKG